MINRRAFMKNGAMTLFATGLGGIPSFIAQAAKAGKIITPYKKNKILICIFQRGAMDGLMAVNPYSFDELKKARPSLFMSPSNKEGSLFDLDGSFGLHPSLLKFNNLFTENRMAIVHGVGSPNNTRSHFDAQDFMESGTPFNKGTESGWLNRAIGLTGHEGSPFRAVSSTSSLPRSFYGKNETLSISDLQSFSLKATGKNNSSNVSKSFESLYDSNNESLLNKTSKDSFEALKILNQKNISSYKAKDGINYPNSPLGNALKQLAVLIKMDIGLEVGFAESGGWDTHYNQGTTNGTMARNLSDFSDSIAAFWSDIEIYQDQVTLMSMTEFGRTVHQNGTGGTDHGRASCMFVLGNDILGGKVYNKIAGFSKELLEDERDLPVTTDFRSVFSTVATNHLSLIENNILFPEWDGPKLNLIRS